MSWRKFLAGGWFRTKTQFANAIRAAADLGKQSLAFTEMKMEMEMEMEMGVLCAIAYHQPIDRAGLKDIWGRKSAEIFWPACDSRI